MLLSCAPHTVADGTQSQRPNIVVILADDMGYGDVGALNSASSIPTPNLDRLAREGMTFTDGHSPSAVCTPTRYAMLTGRYCWRTRLKSGVLGGYSPPLLEPGRRTFADLLAGNGYATAAIGKWHLGMRMPVLADDANRNQWQGDPGIDWDGRIEAGPTTHGFGYYFGISASLDMAPYVYIRDDRFTMAPTEQQPAVAFPHFVRQGPRAADFTPDTVLDRLTEEAVAFVQRAAAQSAPFLLYLPLSAPHKPTQPHERFRGNTGLGEYGDFVAQVDWSVGAVMDSLEAAGVLDDTLLIYTSDNGSYMRRLAGTEKDHVDDPKVQAYRTDRHRPNGNLRGTKADIWEAGHRVPLLVRWPGVVAKGSRCATTVCTVDLFATFAEIVGAEVGADEAEDSLSMLSLLRGGDTPRAAPVVHHSASGMFAVREGRWKLVLGNGSGGREAPKGKPFEPPFSLFDLEADPGETQDLAAERPEIVEHLTAVLDQLRKRGRSVAR